MIERMKAKPTRYNGTQFRSKSEAKLALCFDALRKSWEYEPDIEHEQWRPDFLVRFNVDSLRVGTLIEYKPAIPNGGYITELASHFGAVINSEKAVCDFFNIDCVVCQLWCIDFWNNKINGLCFHSESEIEVIDDELASLDLPIFRANRFRFDLSHN